MLKKIGAPCGHAARVLLLVTMLAGCGRVQQCEEGGFVAVLSAAYAELYASEVRADHASKTLMVNLRTERGVSALVDEVMEYYTRRNSLHPGDVLLLIQFAMVVVEHGSTEDAGRLYDLLSDSDRTVEREMPEAEKLISHSRASLQRRMFADADEDGQ